MIVGASLGSFRGLDLNQAMELYLKLAGDFGLGAVEIRFEKEKGRPSLWPWEVNQRVSKFTSQFPVSGAHLPFAYLNPISMNSGIRTESLNQLKLGIRKASELSMHYVVMHARGAAYDMTQEQQLAEWARLIAELVVYAEEHSVILTVENADSLANLRQLATLIREIGSKSLKITFDVGHAYTRIIPHLSLYPVRELLLKALDTTLPCPLTMPFGIKSGMPFDEYGSIPNFINAEHDLIFGWHLHDYNGRNGHMTIGDGKIDFSFLPALEDAGFLGPLILEPEFNIHYSDFKTNYERLQKLITR